MAIVELSNQIALLQAENDRLMAELSTISKKKPMQKEVHPALRRWMNKVAEDKYNELMEMYAERISAIRQVEPGWQPPTFFDIGG